MNEHIIAYHKHRMEKAIQRIKDVSDRIRARRKDKPTGIDYIERLKGLKGITPIDI